MAYNSDVQRITRALNWIGAGALGSGIVVVVWALWWTRGVDDFRTAVIVAALGFGLPSLVALTLAWLLDPLLDGERGAALAAPPRDSNEPARLRFGFYDWPALFRYLAAIVAVGLSAVLRLWLYPVLGDTVTTGSTVVAPELAPPDAATATAALIATNEPHRRTDPRPRRRECGHRTPPGCRCPALVEGGTVPVARQARHPWWRRRCSRSSTVAPGSCGILWDRTRRRFSRGARP